MGRGEKKGSWARVGDETEMLNSRNSVYSHFERNLKPRKRGKGSENNKVNRRRQRDLIEFIEYLLTLFSVTQVVYKFIFSKFLQSNKILVLQAQRPYRTSLKIRFTRAFVYS